MVKRLHNTICVDKHDWLRQSATTVIVTPSDPAWGSYRNICFLLPKIRLFHSNTIRMQPGWTTWRKSTCLININPNQYVKGRTATASYLCRLHMRDVNNNIVPVSITQLCYSISC